jgi:Mrp family chromosome partitioning ATPase
LHVETHRSVEIGDFLAQEATHFRSRLSQTEDELRNTRKNSGVISLEGNTKANAELIAAVRQQIFAAEAELAERSSFLQEQQKRTKTKSAVQAPAAAQSIITRLNFLRNMEQELLTQFREQHPRVKDVRAQIADAESAMRQLEEQYPNLVWPDSAVTRAPGIDIDAEAERVSALKTKITVLQSQLKELLAEAAVINQVEPKITELRRKKDLEEANYHRFSASLEQARIDAALASGRVSNISQIQAPSPPVPNQSKTLKMCALLGSGGIMLGLGWAYLIEFYLDRSIRRRTDVERIARPPLFLSIPYFGKNGTRRLAGSRLTLQSGESRDKSNRDFPLRPFHEALRDQLIGYFEGKGIKHEPKLIGVTGIGANAGVSTIAAGLARSLSEIGEGNVLLVDMTIGQESARHFVHGEATCHLNQVLETPAPALVAGNLYVASDNSRQDQLSDNLPQRFSKLAPKLKSSAFQFIIFDLPSLSPISIASRVSPLMDFVVTVVQSEKTDQGVLERAMILLGQTNTPVGVVLNKTRTYVPAWLQQEFVGES